VLHKAVSVRCRGLESVRCELSGRCSPPTVGECCRLLEGIAPKVCDEGT
jgi:hypothetical protein